MRKEYRAVNHLENNFNYTNTMNVTQKLRTFLFAAFAFTATAVWAADDNPQVVCDLLNRIGGNGAADRFVTQVDETLKKGTTETFTLSSSNGKPFIKGSSVLAVTTGINWYLNHTARINLSWNNLTTDLVNATLPLPAKNETHKCTAPYRYYLNYCTFSYSMSTWTWQRWQQEIDWMALHGINMPLQIVGLDVVWHNLLTKRLGYTEAEANSFIAGPCFQAWWGMNNLQGWGGPNPTWWYTRQEKLCKDILARERELGMTPVLPGYAGMVPSDIASKGYSANNQGNWCSFVRPYILDPNSDAFATISDLYYKELKEVMDTSLYYSMDPFHEGANTSGIDVPSAYKKIAQAMTAAKSDAKWVIQFWQWSGEQYNVLSQVDKGKLIVLDLYSDAHTHFSEYNGHDAVYCMLPNFGGRTGLFGRLSKVMTGYFSEKNANSNVKGIGATPEAIEQVPVLYDALFELPWLSSVPSPTKWLADYTISRYGTDNQAAKTAWEKIRNSALACPTSLQGPQEAVLCARPALTVNSVSSWGGTSIFYDLQDVREAAFQLYSAHDELQGENYSYDLTDFSRQALTDYANELLKAINAAYSQGQTTDYKRLRDAYLQLILDIDELLSTNKSFMLGRWTQMARGIADEVSGTTETDRQWLELDNARTLISTWGGRDASENGGLRDYSYREWAGMLRDYYYDRWKLFFDALDNGTSAPDWFTHDWNWAHNAELSYSNVPVGSTAEVASRLLTKYFVTLKADDESVYRASRFFESDATENFTATALRGETFTLNVDGISETDVKCLGIDLDGDGTITADESFTSLSVDIPTSAITGKDKAVLTLTDGTVVSFSLIIKDNVTENRTVSVSTSDEKAGKVQIVGRSSKSVTTMKEVSVKATANSGYDFVNWTDGTGKVITTQNPYTYYGADDIELCANFMTNKWGQPEADASELNVISDYGQYLTSLTVSQRNRSEQSIYEASACPSTLFETSRMASAAQGSQLTLHWKSAGGMDYCRLSAYIDLNADGDFDDADELVSVYGKKKEAANGALNDYTLNVLLPYDIPTGVTHIRLRFDGAWNEGWDAKTDAMPANHKTMRMVYDIPLNILSQASYACSVGVKTDDATMGTVDANGQPDTYVYAVGEDVVLRAYPATGYVVKEWRDIYGRVVPDSWRDGNFLRFHAPENGTFTAVFSSKSDAIAQVVSAPSDHVKTYTLDGRRATDTTKGVIVGSNGTKTLRN